MLTLAPRFCTTLVVVMGLSIGAKAAAPASAIKEVGDEVAEEVTCFSTASVSSILSNSSYIYMVYRIGVYDIGICM